MGVIKKQHRILLHLNRRPRDVVGHSVASTSDGGHRLQPGEPERARHGQGCRSVLLEFRPRGRHEIRVRHGQRRVVDRVEEGEDQHGESLKQIPGSLRSSGFSRSQRLQPRSVPIRRRLDRENLGGGYQRRELDFYYVC